MLASRVPSTQRDPASLAGRQPLGLPTALCSSGAAYSLPAAHCQGAIQARPSCPTRITAPQGTSRRITGLRRIS